MWIFFVRPFVKDKCFSWRRKMSNCSRAFWCKRRCLSSLLGVSWWVFNVSQIVQSWYPAGRSRISYQRNSHQRQKLDSMKAQITRGDHVFLFASKTFEILLNATLRRPSQLFAKVQSRAWPFSALMCEKQRFWVGTLRLPSALEIRVSSSVTALVFYGHDSFSLCQRVVSSIDSFCLIQSLLWSEDMYQNP